MLKANLLFAFMGSLAAIPAAQAEGHGHWSYEGHGSPSHWAELDEHFETCKLGRHQSPINIVTRKTRKSAAHSLNFAYTASSGEVSNNGHTVQVSLPGGSAVEIDGSKYQLLQFHFHTPSEEKIDGKAYPLVAHLVHKNGEGKLAVVALLFKEGRENQALKSLFAHLPEKEGENLTLESPIDTAALLPQKQGYYAFQGSLTTPPCSEEVSWQVLKTPVEISAGQLAAFRKLYKMNARPVQPLHSRIVESIG